MLIHQHKLGAAFFAKKVAEVQQRTEATLKELGIFVKAPESFLHSPDYPDILLASSLAEFLHFMTFTFEDEEALEKKTRRTIWNPYSIKDDERREKRERDAGRARYTARHKVLTGHLKNNVERV